MPCDEPNGPKENRVCSMNDKSLFDYMNVTALCVFSVYLLSDRFCYSFCFLFCETPESGMDKA